MTGFQIKFVHALALVFILVTWASNVGAVREYCYNAPDSGESELMTPSGIRFYYDAIENECFPFKYYGTYSGFGQPINNFESENECMNICGYIAAFPEFLETFNPVPMFRKRGAPRRGFSFGSIF